MLICKNCGKEKSENDFSVHIQCKSGYDISRCKACKKSAFDWKKQPLNKRIYNRAKARAKEKGIEFTIELSDITIPDVCPVFKIPFVYGDHGLTYSIDRIDPNKGYVKGNVIIMCNRANMMKNNATLEEVELLYLWMKSLKETTNELV